MHYFLSVTEGRVQLYIDEAALVDIRKHFRMADSLVGPNLVCRVLDGDRLQFRIAHQGEKGKSSPAITNSARSGWYSMAWQRLKDEKLFDAALPFMGPSTTRVLEWTATAFVIGIPAQGSRNEHNFRYSKYVDAERVVRLPSPTIPPPDETVVRNPAPPAEPEALAGSVDDLRQAVRRVNALLEIHGKTYKLTKRSDGKLALEVNL